MVNGKKRMRMKMNKVYKFLGEMRRKFSISNSWNGSSITIKLILSWNRSSPRCDAAIYIFSGKWSLIKLNLSSNVDWNGIEIPNLQVTDTYFFKGLRVYIWSFPWYYSIHICVSIIYTCIHSHLLLCDHSDHWIFYDPIIRREYFHKIKVTFLSIKWIQ